jgi:hypothetical protein
MPGAHILFSLLLIKVGYARIQYMNRQESNIAYESS